MSPECSIVRVSGRASTEPSRGFSVSGERLFQGRGTRRALAAIAKDTLIPRG